MYPSKRGNARPLELPELAGLGESSYYQSSYKGYNLWLGV